MAHSIELLLDDPADRRIRRDWQTLVEAGLPSQARIDASTNRPHITLFAAPRLPATESIRAVLAPSGAILPVIARIGAPIVFGHHDRFVLARSVVPNADLLHLHEYVYTQMTTAQLPEEPFAHLAPGAWTPHITLARRLRADQVGAALPLLDPTTDLAEVSLETLRHWNSDTRSEHLLLGATH